MRFFYRVVIGLFLLSSYSAWANTSNLPGDPFKTRRTYKEITKTDITRYKNITSSEIMVFGIHLGMSVEECQNALKNNRQVFLKQDPFNPNRYYLYDTSRINNRYVCLGYLKWESRLKENEKKLSEIVFYFDFIKYLVGRSKNLLTLEIINKHSQIVKDFMGYPATRTEELDIPSLGLRAYSYFYPNHYFKVIRYISDEGSSLSFSILLPE